MSAQIQLVELGRTSIPLPNISPNRADSGQIARGEAITASTVEARLRAIPFEEMEGVFDGSEGVLFAYFNFLGRPSFTQAILRDIGRMQDMVRTLFAAGGGSAPVKYIVWDSRMPGVWNLGGDLDLFATLIRRRDREALMRYSRAVWIDRIDRAPESEAAEIVDRPAADLVGILGSADHRDRSRIQRSA